MQHVAFIVQHVSLMSQHLLHLLRSTFHFFVYKFHFECNVLHFCLKNLNACNKKSQRMQQGHSLKIRNNVTQSMQQSQNMQQCHSKYATMSQNMQHLLRHYKLFYIIPLRRCTRLCNFRRKNLFINWNI